MFSASMMNRPPTPPPKDSDRSHKRRMDRLIDNHTTTTTSDTNVNDHHPASLLHRHTTNVDSSSAFKRCTHRVEGCQRARLSKGMDSSFRSWGHANEPDHLFRPGVHYRSASGIHSFPTPARSSSASSASSQTVLYQEYKPLLVYGVLSQIASFFSHQEACRLATTCKAFATEFRSGSENIVHLETPKSYTEYPYHKWTPGFALHVHVQAWNVQSSVGDEKRMNQLLYLWLNVVPIPCHRVGGLQVIHHPDSSRETMTASSADIRAAISMWLPNDARAADPLATWTSDYSHDLFTVSFYDKQRTSLQYMLGHHHLQGAGEFTHLCDIELTRFYNLDMQPRDAWNEPIACPDRRFLDNQLPSLQSLTLTTKYLRLFEQQTYRRLDRLSIHCDQRRCPTVGCTDHSITHAPEASSLRLTAIHMTCRSISRTCLLMSHTPHLRHLVLKAHPSLLMHVIHCPSLTSIHLQVYDTASNLAFYTSETFHVFATHTWPHVTTFVLSLLPPDTQYDLHDVFTSLPGAFPNATHVYIQINRFDRLDIVDLLDSDDEWYSPMTVERWSMLVRQWKTSDVHGRCQRYPHSLDWIHRFTRIQYVYFGFHVAALPTCRSATIHTLAAEDVLLNSHKPNQQRKTKTTFEPL